MRLAIDHQISIISDQHSWALAERRERTRHGRKVTEWQPFLWYSSLEKACSGFVERSLRLSDAESLAEALADVDRAVAKLCAALHPQFEVKACHGVDTTDGAYASERQGSAKAEKCLGGATPFERIENALADLGGAVPNNVGEAVR